MAIKNNKKVNEKDILEQILEQMENLKKRNEELEKQLKKNKTVTQPVSASDEEVAIGCNQLTGGALETKDGSVSVEFNYGEEKEISSEELKILLRRAGLKNLFSDGLFYFVDDENYKKYKIGKHVDLSDENIISIFNSTSSTEVISRLDDLTNNKRSEAATHNLIFKIAYMIISGSLANMDFNVRMSLSKYFDIDFEHCVHALEQYKNIK